MLNKNKRYLKQSIW